MATAFRALGAVLLCGTAGMTIAALLNNSWYTLSASGATASIGLYKTCSSTTCTDITYTDVSFGSTCTRTKADQEFRIKVVQGLNLATIVTAGLGILLALFSCAPSAHPAAFGAMAMAFLAMAAGACDFAVHGFTMERWLYCDRNYCELIKALGFSGSCTATFGAGFFLMCGATGAALLAMVFLLIAGLTGGPPEAPPTQTSRSEPASQAAASDPAKGADSAAEQPPAKEADPAVTTTADGVILPGPDWILDEGSGYYWNEEAYMYYDAVSGWFFDPNHNMWYDPQTEQWQ